MYDELVKRLNVFRLKEDEYQIIPVYVSELIGEAADAIEELQQIAAHYEETAQEYKAVYRKEHNKRIAENRYLYDELTKSVREKLLMTPMRIELQEPPKEET